MSVESFAHRTAKGLMLTWLRQAAAKAGYDRTAQFPLSQRGYDQEAPPGVLRWVERPSISWRVNRPGPHWGVWPEYPFAISDRDLFEEGDLNIGRRWLGGADIVWDEYGGDRRPYENRVPTVGEITGRGLQLLYVVDIAVQHKGMISTIIEITHKNPLEPEKRMVLQNYVGEIWEIPAAWVLGQIGKPKMIPAEFRVT